jgi:uncharacterized protein (TIGR03000 family)
VILDSAPVPAVGVPTLAPAPTPPTPPAPNRSSIERTRSGRGVLTIRVPHDAKVTINGTPTKSLGSVRQYSCDGLLPGSAYKFEVKAEVVREGKVVTDTQTVSLTAGERSRVAFSFDVRATEGLAAAK